jgi:hypothetical protein
MYTEAAKVTPAPQEANRVNLLSQSGKKCAITMMAGGAHHSE